MQQPIRHINNLNPFIPMPADAYAAQQGSELLMEELDWLLR